MTFHTNTIKKILWLTVIFSVSIPFAASGAQGGQNSASQRKADLEHSLAAFDAKVADAKQELLKAAIDRRSNGLQIADRRKLIDALRQQLHAAAESRGFYDSLAATEKDDVVSFIRYVSGRQLASIESGPSLGGPLLKTMLRGTLGESVDRALADHALLLAREQVASQLHAIVAEADTAQVRIRSVLEDLNTQVDGLKKQGDNLGDTVDQTMALIDNSWREKKLNEEELKHVQQETAEANGKIGEMQSSLVRIDSEIKDEKVKQLKESLDAVIAERDALSKQSTELLRKDEAMRMLQDGAKEAIGNADKLRNSDPKIFKRIEEAELRLQQLEADAGNATDIALLKDQIALMKTGVPEAAAKEAVSKRHATLEVDDVRRDIASQIAGITQKIAALDVSIPAKKLEFEKAEQSQDSDGSAPVFSWPVRGSITAGYYDPDYQKVFGVPHRAIDIAVPQATPIHVVSAGVVFAVKDGGRTGYSYILIGHEGGYASLYGHVSASFVKPGDKVLSQQVIGLTGGAPGSHGAGPMTTGSHLHLEMTKNGEHINPVSVLQ